jgi:exodeoxyribonuclease-1
LTGQAAERWKIDLALVDRHARVLTAAPDLASKVRQVHLMDQRPPETDPDLMIYAGGFFSDEDRREMARLRNLSPAELANARYCLRDPRGEIMLFRYRARNWPETLTPEEREEWDSWRFERLTDPDAGASITMDTYLEKIASLRSQHSNEPRYLGLLDELELWADRIMDAAV